MAAGAAERVDHILPHVPLRQWLLSLPHAPRYRLAWDHMLCRAVLTIYTRALLGFERQRGPRRKIMDGRSGTVTAIQRFGSGVQLNVHYHTLLLEGAFVTAPEAPRGSIPRHRQPIARWPVCLRRFVRASCGSCAGAVCSRPTARYRSRFARRRCARACATERRRRPRAFRVRLIRPPPRRRRAAVTFVELVGTPASGPALEVVLPAGYSVSVAPGFDATTLRTLLTMLEAPR